MDAFENQACCSKYKNLPYLKGKNLGSNNKIPPKLGN